MVDTFGARGVSGIFGHGAETTFGGVGAAVSEGTKGLVYTPMPAPSEPGRTSYQREMGGGQQMTYLSITAMEAFASHVNPPSLEELRLAGGAGLEP